MYQFIRVDEYSRIKTAKKKSMHCIALECERKPGYTGHIHNPRKAVLVYGEPVTKIVKNLCAVAEESKVGQRKLPKNRRILLSGIASYPISVTELGGTKETLRNKNFRKWLDLTKDFLRKEYGQSLRSIILHLDEEYPHIHFYCHEEPDDRGRLALDSIHPGISAERKCMENTKAAKRQAFKNGLRSFSDRYYDSVSEKFSHMRRGPQPKTRLPYKVAKMIQTINKDRERKFYLMKNKLYKKEAELIEKEIKIEEKMYDHELEIASLRKKLSEREALISEMKNIYSKTKKRLENAQDLRG